MASKKKSAKKTAKKTTKKSTKKTSAKKVFSVKKASAVQPVVVPVVDESGAVVVTPVE